MTPRVSRLISSQFRLYISLRRSPVFRAKSNSAICSGKSSSKAFLSFVSSSLVNQRIFELFSRRCLTNLAGLEEAAAETSKQHLPDLVRKGKFCHPGIEEIKKIRYLGVKGGWTMAEIRDEYPAFAVWHVVKSLEKDDQDTFEHPRSFALNSFICGTTPLTRVESRRRRTHCSQDSSKPKTTVFRPRSVTGLPCSLSHLRGSRSGFENSGNRS